MSQESPFQDLGASDDPKAVPWHDAVVWSDRSVDGKRVYQWIPKSEIRSVSWTNGLVSVHIADGSFLAKDLMFILLQAPFVAIGRNVPV